MLEFKPSEQAQKEGVCHTDAECEQLYLTINPKIKQDALAFIRSKITLADAEKIRTLILQYGKNDWLPHLADDQIAKLSPEDLARGYAGMYSPHFGWGMAVRNILRQHGFGEKELGVHNLDDIYVALVAEALEQS